MRNPPGFAGLALGLANLILAPTMFWFAFTHFQDGNTTAGFVSITFGAFNLFAGVFSIIVYQRGWRLWRRWSTGNDASR